MTLKIDLDPQEEAWLAAQSAQQGVAPKDIVKQMIDEQLAPRMFASAYGSGHPAAPQNAAPTISAESAAAIAFLDARVAEDIAADAETKRKAEEELAEFKRSMNANRTATGERLVYP